MVKVILKVPEADMDEWLVVAAQVVQRRHQDIIDNGLIVYGFTNPTRFLVCRTTKTGAIVAELRGGNEE